MYPCLTKLTVYPGRASTYSVKNNGVAIHLEACALSQATPSASVLDIIIKLHLIIVGGAVNRKSLEDFHN